VERPTAFGRVAVKVEYKSSMAAIAHRFIVCEHKAKVDSALGDFFGREIGSPGIPLSTSDCLLRFGNC
jgi:hypothetical protein